MAIHDDRMHFEFLIIEGAQAGLSCSTVLKKREGYRRAFADFVPAVVAQFSESYVEGLLLETGIIRNRLKIQAAVTNAREFLKIQKEFGSFDRYICKFVGGRPKVNTWKSLKEVPATTAESDALSKDLKKRGFNSLVVR